MKTGTTPQQTFELQQAIETAFFDNKKLALAKRTEFYILGDLVSHLQVVGSGEQLQRLLDLIFEATITHASASEIFLTTRQLLQTDTDILIEFCLEDNGPNLRANSRGFKYYRALATARQMITELNGKSEVMSVPGVKTTLKFVIRFELHRQEEGRTNAYSFARLNGKKVLLAEDNEVNQEAVIHILKKYGIEVHVAGNGKEALELFERNCGYYDLVLMDILMPFMDGVQTTNYIRKKLKSNVPVIALTTGISGDDSQLDYFEVGINEYIAKPFREAELLKAINRVCVSNPVLEPSFSQTKIA